MSLFSELEATLREFAAGGPAELRENGKRVAPLSLLSWEVRGSPEKPLLHLWSENHNLTRRVLAITDHSEQRVALAVECFGRKKPDRWEFLRAEYERPANDLSRDAFVQRTRQLCAAVFPDETLESLTGSPDLEHSLSGSYARGVLRRGPQQWAFLAVPSSGAEEPARCLTFALLWLDRLMQGNGRRTIAGVRLLLPSGTAAPVARLLSALHPDLRVELYERDDLLETARRIEPSEVTNVSSFLLAAREAQALVERARRELEPFLPRSRQALSFHPNVASKEVVVRFRGLSWVSWQEAGIFFGVREQQGKLQPANKAALSKLFQELEKHRNPLASNTRHAMFRAQAERWMEFLVREDVSRIDPALDSRFAYSQVLAATAGEHGILDVLAATRTGRLAIVELKADEDPVFLLQAAKYWLRIRHHLEQNDFPRHGYFPGVVLQSRSPLIYLVAPALRFHPATGSLLKYLHPEIEVLRVGLAENWRRGLCVVLRQ